MRLQSEPQTPFRHPGDQPGDQPRCRVCGCRQLAACPGGCAWVEADLCTACLPLLAPGGERQLLAAFAIAFGTVATLEPRDTAAYWQPRLHALTNYLIGRLSGEVSEECSDLPAPPTLQEEAAYARGIAWTLGLFGQLYCPGVTMRDVINELDGNGYSLERLKELGADDYDLEAARDGTKN